MKLLSERGDVYEADGPGGKNVRAARRSGKVLRRPERLVRRSAPALALALAMALFLHPQAVTSQDGRPPALPRAVGGGFPLQVTGQIGHQWHSRLGGVAGTIVQAGAAGSDNGSPLEAVIRVAPADLLGASLEWRAGPRYTVAVGASRLNSSLSVDGRIGDGPGDEARPFALRRLGTVRVDAVELTARRHLGPVSWIVRPHLDMGVGATRWTLRDLDELDDVSELVGNPVSLSDVRTTFPTGTLGAGAEMSAGRWVLLRLELSGRVTPNPIDDQDFRLGENFQGIGSPADRIVAFRTSLAVIIRPR
ncbi:MAG: hypothetical protein WEA09_02750 [Gemmatimonadota bacterium]